MHIGLITPAPPNSRSGNRCTASRWANILRELGHKVDVAEVYEGQAVDILLALHAWRSADSIHRFHQLFPQRPLIVALTGTDAYRFIHSDPEVTLRSIEQADYLVGLHELIVNTVPIEYRDKVHVIVQSASGLPVRQPIKDAFRVCVAGHLRDEKDSLRPALAARLLKSDSRIEIHHYGKAHTADWAEKANQEMLVNSRYHWHGEIAHEQLVDVYSQSHLLVLPSRMEGGANVISESVMAGLPIIASDIEGSVGLLGQGYPGYFPVEDERALSEILYRAETDVGFYQQLANACQDRVSLFQPEAELLAWRRLMEQVVSR